MNDLTPARCELSADPTIGTVRLQLSGSWRLSQPLPAAADVERQLEGRNDARRVVFEAQGITDKAAAMKQFHEAGREHEEFKLQLIQDDESGEDQLTIDAVGRSERVHEVVPVGHRPVRMPPLRNAVDVLRPACREDRSV